MGRHANTLTHESVGPLRAAAPPPMRAVGLAVLLVLVLVLGVGCATYRASRLYVSGTRALDAGDVERAIVDLEAAASLAPQGSEIYNHLGLAYSDAGRRVAALHAFDRALEIDCDNEAAKRNRAKLVAGTTHAPE